MLPASIIKQVETPIIIIAGVLEQLTRFMSHDQPEKRLQNFRSDMNVPNVRDGDGKMHASNVVSSRRNSSIREGISISRNVSNVRVETLGGIGILTRGGKKSRFRRLCRGFFVTIRFRREIVPRSIHNRFTGKQFLGRKDDRFPGPRRAERFPSGVHAAVRLKRRKIRSANVAFKPSCSVVST